ncbi:MAG: AAA family ATPase [Pseudonocardia sp.]|nr:AAA family ATPase [Pseudonocardia sp.]
MRVNVELLGGFRVAVDDRPVPDGMWRRRAVDLVALLALAPQRRLLRDQVVDALWPELAPEAGAANLHKAAHHARRALEREDAVVVRGGGVALFPADEVVVDVDRFLAAAVRATRSNDRAACAAAADLGAGELLPDRRYEQWTAAHRDELDRVRLDLYRRAQRWADVLAREPTDEAAHLALMRECADRGNRHGAIRQFQRLRSVLARELGVGPGQEATELYRRVVAGLARTGPGPMIGREVPLARTGAALLASGAGAVLVTGEAGIGKTRLCATIAGRARDAGYTVLRATAAESGTGPYATAFAAARSAGRGVVEGLPADARAALSGRGRPTRQQVLAALARVCRAATAQRGTLLLVDDAHLADEDSVSLLGALARSAEARCRLVLALRLEEAGAALRELRDQLCGRPGTVEIALGPLSREESDELVARLCPRRVPSDAFDRVWQLAGGNPFATGELAAALAESGSVAVPQTLAAAIAARTEHLPAELVDVLRRVAVVSETIDVDEFVALSGLDEGAAFETLDLALDAGVLVADGDGYRFRHALVAHALADGLPPHRRRQVHQSVAEELAAGHAAPARVARHLRAAGRADEAVPWLVRAAEDAAAVSGYTEALRHVEVALDIAPHRTDLLAMRAEHLLAAGDPAAGAAFATAAAATTGSIRDVLRTRQAWALLTVGDVPAASQALDGIEPDEVTRLPLALTGGLLAWFTGRFDDAARAAGECVALAADSGRQEHLLAAAFLQAIAAHSRGGWAGQFRTDLADPRLDGVLAGALSDAHLCASEMYLFSEGPGDIAAVAARLRDAAARAGAARGEAFATTLLGEAVLLAGDLDAAEAHLLDGARQHRALRAAAGEAVALHRLAELAMADGRSDAVAPLLDQALDAARSTPLGARHLLPRIFGTRVRAAAGTSSDAAFAAIDEAQRCLVRPAEVCPADRVPYLVPVATTLARAGRPEDACAALDAADMIVGMLWNGRGGWAAAVTEARADVAAARGAPEQADALRASAAHAFSRAGQPLDAARCAAAAERGHR